ncbi:hypothetical protein JM84_1870 [Dokdonia sp. Hel_I_63]|uniref:hypothetical protein n=1 Tax=Dokdonia sp. Hel_I_63 TaxID=1249996 RepID=UPI00119BE82D|nr:hypothetical protein [Dokdonia sp. Hel_I_63]TVZ22956.1 hypothetical protein JM84_1870 [Dokdonia sp. Hel_I_63]
MINYRILFYLVFFLSTVNVYSQSTIPPKGERRQAIRLITKEDLSKFRIDTEESENEVLDFKLRVDKRPSILVKGNKIDGRGLSLIQKTSRGSKIIVYDIRRKIVDSLKVGTYEFVVRE